MRDELIGILVLIGGVAFLFAAWKVLVAVGKGGLRPDPTLDEIREYRKSRR